MLELLLFFIYCFDVFSNLARRFFHVFLFFLFLNLGRLELMEMHVTVTLNFRDGWAKNWLRGRILDWRDDKSPLISGDFLNSNLQRELGRRMVYTWYTIHQSKGHSGIMGLESIVGAGGL